VSINIPTVVCTDLSEELSVLLLSVAASVFTVVAGEGGGLFMGYFAVAGVFASLLCYFFASFFPVDDTTSHPWGFSYSDRPVVDVVCEIVQCGKTIDLHIAGNSENSPLTFSSSVPYLAGLAHLLSMCLIPLYILIIFAYFIIVILMRNL